LDWAGSVLIASTLLAIVLTRIYDRESLDIGFAALAISNSISLFPFFSFSFLIPFALYQPTLLALLSFSAI
jgi:hypothetical protein